MTEQPRQRKPEGSPAGWARAPLRGVSQVILGQSPPSSTYNEEGDGLPFFQGKAEFGEVYPTVKKWCSNPNKTAEEGDVLISVRAPVGPTNICPENACIGRGLAAVRPLAGMESKFLLYLLRAFEDELAGRGTGTTFDAITGAQLRGLTVPLPPLNEQRRIVEKIEELFTRLDAGVEELHEARKRLESYRQAVLRDAFTGKLTEQWREAHKGELEPAAALLERIEQERRDGDVRYKRRKKVRPLDPAAMSPLPEGWQWVYLGDIGAVSGGLTRNRKKRAGLPIEMPYLRVANVYADELRLDDVKAIKVRESELDRVLLERGDLLVVEGNGSVDQIGRVALWDGSISPCVHQNHLIKVRFRPNRMGRYVLHWLLSFDGRDHVVRVASSTSGLHTLSLSKVSSLPVPLCSLAEQQQIVSDIERHFSVIEAAERTIEQSLKRAGRLRQSILKRAFEGRLVPQDPSDEPADHLLERIRAEKAAT